MAFQAQVGTILNERYMLLDPLGKGGMGETWVALDLLDHGMEEKPHVVVKLIKPEYRDVPRYISYFQREIAIASVASDGSLVRTFHHATHDGVPYCVMEWVKGTSLEGLRRSIRWKQQPIEDRVELALYCFSYVIEALHFLHELKGVDGQPLGIVHRDVCPNNVFLSVTGDVKLGDFGVARSRYKYDVAHSGAGFIGKTPYMCQLHVQLLGDCSPKADLFAAGAVLYELLECRGFREECVTLEALAFAVTTGDVPFLSAGYDPNVVDLYTRLVTLKFSSASEVIECLRDIGVKHLRSELGPMVARVSGYDPAGTRGIIQPKPSEDKGHGDRENLALLATVVPVAEAPLQSLWSTRRNEDEESTKPVLASSSAEPEERWSKRDEEASTQPVPASSSAEPEERWSKRNEEASTQSVPASLPVQEQRWSKRNEEAPTKPVPAYPSAEPPSQQLWSKRNKEESAKPVPAFSSAEPPSQQLWSKRNEEESAKPVPAFSSAEPRSSTESHRITLVETRFNTSPSFELPETQLLADHELLVASSQPGHTQPHVWPNQIEAFGGQEQGVKRGRFFWGVVLAILSMAAMGLIGATIVLKDSNSFIRANPVSGAFETEEPESPVEIRGMPKEASHEALATSQETSASHEALATSQETSAANEAPAKSNDASDQEPIQTTKIDRKPPRPRSRPDVRPLEASLIITLEQGRRWAQVRLNDRIITMNEMDKMLQIPSGRFQLAWRAEPGGRWKRISTVSVKKDDRLTLNIAANKAWVHP